MIVATTEAIAGHDTIETKGQVFGLIVRSRGLAGHITAALRSLGGGEIHEYTSMLEDSRRQAIDRMVQSATAMGANAITMMRFDSSARPIDGRGRCRRHRGRDQAEGLSARLRCRS